MAFLFCPEIVFLRQNNEGDYMALIETEFDTEKIITGSIRRKKIPAFHRYILLYCYIC